MKVTITRAKMLATLRASQKADLKAQAENVAKAKSAHEKAVKAAIERATKFIAELKAKGHTGGDGVGGVYEFDLRSQRHYGRYGYNEQNLNEGETQYDSAIAFVEACEDTQFVLDVEKDRTGLSQVFFAALKRK